MKTEHLNLTEQLDLISMADLHACAMWLNELGIATFGPNTTIANLHVRPHTASDNGVILTDDNGQDMILSYRKSSNSWGFQTHQSVTTCHGTVPDGVFLNRSLMERDRYLHCYAEPYAPRRAA